MASFTCGEPAAHFAMAIYGEYKALSVGMKVALLRDVAKGHLSLGETAEKYSALKSTISAFATNKDEALKSQDENFNSSRKRMQISPYPDIEEAVLEWICNMRY